MTISFTLKLLIMNAGVLVSLIVGGIVLLRSLFLFVTVKGVSMTPTLQHQDHVLVLRVRTAWAVKKGAIVLLDASAVSHLSSPGISIIKRVVAVAGETYTDPGTNLPLLSIGEPPSLKQTRHWHIPPGEIFVCGDHLVASFDSRIWGPVPLSVVKGVVIYHFKKEPS